MLTCILQPYTRVNTKNPYPILDLFLMLTGLRKVVVLPAVSIFKCHLQGNFLRLNSSSNWLILWKIIPYSRPKISDFYTLIESKLAEYHTLHSGTYLYSSYMGSPPPPGSYSFNFIDQLHSVIRHHQLTIHNSLDLGFRISIRVLPANSSQNHTNLDSLTLPTFLRT